MEKMITLEIPQSEWERFKEEIIRMAAVMQERKRESDERWERMAALDVQYEQIMAQLRKEKANVEKHLGRGEFAVS